MKASKIYFVAWLALISGSGCLMMDNRPLAASWPKRSIAIDLKQFDGVYENCGTDSKSNKPDNSTLKLFDYLSAYRLRTNSGILVEIRTSSDGEKLQARLLDLSHRELDRMELHQGRDFEWVHGSLQLLGVGPKSFSEKNHFGISTGHQSERLFVSSSGALLGKRSEGGFALFYYAVPVAGSNSEWMLWNKVSVNE